MGADRTFQRWASSGLVWLPEHGMGYYPVKEAPYDEAYFERYQRLQETEMGVKLIQARRDLVENYVDPDQLLLDVGIGAGGFLESRWSWARNALGYDVNPKAVEWLRAQGAFFDPYEGRHVYAATFWDSLEHIADPSRVLANVTQWAFVSIPIFTGPEHVLRSKHYRPTEHAWYFTREGIIGWMKAQGFECVEHNTMESLMGREDIHTFAFRRRREMAAPKLSKESVQRILGHVERMLRTPGVRIDMHAGTMPDLEAMEEVGGAYSIRKSDGSESILIATQPIDL